jgi:hypothetical protein
MMPVLIAFSGRAGSGKSHASTYLAAKYGYTRVKFADPLKDMLRAVGLTEEHIEGKLKEEPCDLLCGKTPRFAMQTLGTEWGRSLIDAGLWGNLWSARVTSLLSQGAVVVTDDVRFSNEAGLIKSMGGIVIGLESPASVAVGNHSSEAIDVIPNIIIKNDPSLPGALESTLDFIIGSVIMASSRKAKLS